MGLDPASTPGAHRTITGANGRGNLLIALLRMGIRSQNDSSTHGEGLRRRVCSNEVLKVFGFFSGQFDWISGFGTTHVFSPPAPSLSSLVDAVKLGKHL